MTDVIDYKVYGDDMQIVEIELDPGEGLFLVRLVGPGLVYLQSLPFSRLADRIYAASRSQKVGERRGGLLGGILGDD